MERIKKAYAENGDLKIIPDTPPLDGSENWEQGRGAYYELDNDPNTGDPLALDIDREQDNYFKNVISKNIKHWQENSYPIYFEDIEYPKNATVRYTDGNVYVSKVDNNTTLPTDTDNWVNFERIINFEENINIDYFIKPKSRRGRTLFVKTAPAEITIPKGFKVAMDGFSVHLEDDVVISLDTDLDTGTKEAGRDYLVYMTQEGNFYFKLFVGTFDSSDLLIGGLHYGLVPENATLPASTPNKTEADMANNRGIKAFSMWDLTHRPTANPFGKVLVANKFWRNIYPVDEEYAIRGYSSCYKIGSSTIAKIAGGVEDRGRKFPKIPTMYGGNETANYGRLSYFTACELNSACGMRNPNYSEFSESSYGVKEEKSASELGYETGTGNIKHFPMLESKWGVEQATGVQWTWSSDLMNGYGSTDFQVRLNQTEGRGYMNATANSPVSAIFGGEESLTSTWPDGSRALALLHYVWSSTWYLGVVGVCDHLNLDTVSENEL